MFGKKKKEDLLITYASLSKQGEREENEDYLGVVKDSLYVLCDGLGGHGGGAAASKIVTEAMLALYGKKKLSIEKSILLSQQYLLEMQKKLQAEDAMKTTLTCLEIKGDTARYVHVGDSRIYLFENHKFKQRSLDHSVPQVLVMRGEIKEKEIRKHPDRSKLLRVMGAKWDSPKYQVSEPIPLRKKQSFLLCSDGFWELIEEKKMGLLLKQSSDPAEWLEKMEQVVLEHGKGTGMDNYSAIAVFVR